jgi:hypothetical protein
MVFLEIGMPGVDAYEGYLDGYDSNDDKMEGSIKDNMPIKP